MSRTLVANATLLSLGLLTACVSVGPNYHRPAVETPPVFKEAQGWKVAEPRDAQSRGNWWDIYDDPNLDGLLRQVQVSNQNVVVAEARYRQALALVGTARANYFPTLSAAVYHT